jgi:FkbM family methyltransferase
VVMHTRPDTVDHDICTSSMIEDEYKLAALPELTGLAIDIGAHIGAVTVALALDNPTLRVKAVEIVPENAEMLRLNLAENGIADRVEVVEKAAGGPDEASRTCWFHHRAHARATPEYVAKHRFIGNSFWSPNITDFESSAYEIECVCLSDLADGPVSFIKTDAEGAEWQFLADPSVNRVERIHGEYHWDYVGQGDLAKLKPNARKRPKRGDTPQAEMARLLSKTHVLTMDEHPTIGHFEAVLRS